MSLTSVIRYVNAQDTTATDGSGKTGLAYSDITAKYLVQGGTLQSMTTQTIATLGTFQAPTGAAYIRIKELAASDPTKGVYEIHLSDDLISQVALGKKLWIFLSASGALFGKLEIDPADLSTQFQAVLTAIAAINTGAGSGARTVTITVTDGTDPLQNAKVRMTNGADAPVVTTDVNGEAEFALDDATWSVAITKSGYTFTPTTLVVSGDTTHTYAMTAISITPSDAGLVTGYLECLGTDGESQSGVIVSLVMTKPPTGSGNAFDGDTMQQTSDVDGIVQFVGLAPGGTYQIWRGSNRQAGKLIKIASDATTPYSLDNIAGAD